MAGVRLGIVLLLWTTTLATSLDESGRYLLNHYCEETALFQHRFTIGPAGGADVVNGQWCILELHNDKSLVTKRGSGVNEPYAAGAFARAKPGFIALEWRLVNCLVGLGEGGHTSSVRVDGKDRGTCTWPMCRVEVEDTGKRAVFDVRVSRGESGGGAREVSQLSLKMVAPGAVNGSRLRTRTCLEDPLASPDGALLVADVVYSRWMDQLVLFGPSSRPLGGLYCEWDKNPQTCQPEDGCRATKKCRGERVCPTIAASWLWSDPVVQNTTRVPGHTHGEVHYECAYRGGWGNESFVAAVRGDSTSSLNLATCPLPPPVREWLLAPSQAGGEPPVVEFRSVDARSRAHISSVSFPLSTSAVSRQEERLHSLSICAIFRDQGPYLAEWIEYHMLMGVEHFYLYDHKSLDAPVNELLPYIEGGIVDLHQWDLPGHPQKEAMAHCTHKYGHETLWMAMIDVDEFFLLGHDEDGKKYESISYLLEILDVPDNNVLFVDQIFFGHQGYEHPPGGLVIDNYRYRSSNISKFAYRKKYIFQPSSGSVIVPCIHGVSHGRLRKIVLGHQELRINHYTVKSREHWKADHIKRFQPVPDEWNEERDDEIALQSLWDLRLAMCHTWGKLHKGTLVVPMPEAADCELELRRMDDAGAGEKCLGERCPSRKVVQVGWGYDPCAVMWRHSQCGTAVAEGFRQDNAAGVLAGDNEALSVEEETDLGASGEGEGVRDAAKVGNSVKDPAPVSAESGGGEGGPWIRIVTPLQGTTLLKANLTIEAGGGEGRGSWDECCYIDIFFNREQSDYVDPEDEASGHIAEQRSGSPPSIMPFEHVTRVFSRHDFPVVLDRDRELYPHGPSWHMALVKLHLRENSTDPIATAKVSFRITGQRRMVGGKEAPAAIYKGQQTRKNFPVADPVVCAAFLSCGRLSLLRRGIKALIAHMDDHEPEIPYEIAWVDNASGEEALSVYREFGVERVALNRVNYGVTHGMNTLLFELCRRSRYVITLEEDWEWIDSTTSLEAVSMAIKVVNHDPKVVGVIFRSELDYKMNLSEWRRVDGVEYRLRCLKEGEYGFGAWTNGAALWDRDLLEREFGRQDEEWGDASELEYSQRIGSKYCTAEIRFKQGCEISRCNAVVAHIGEDAKGRLTRSSGWEKYITGFDHQIEWMGKIYYRV